jgi:hypothetical protein
MADAVTPITTHAADALARLLQQFKDKPRIEALLNAINAEVQTYEDEVMDLSDVLDIDLMGGVNLDHIGDIVTQDREGRNDADYRQAIRDKIARNVSSGTPDELIEIFEFLTGSTLSSIDLQEEFPAGYSIYGDAASYPSDILEAMDAATGAAIYVGIFARLIKEGSSDLITTEAGDAIYLRISSTGR